MPKIAKELTALAVKKMKYPAEKLPPVGKGHPHLATVGGVPGLQLQITPNAKSWLLRTTVNGERIVVGLGPYPAIGLAQAREAAGKKLYDIKHNGADPVAERKAKRAAVAETKREAGRTVTFTEALEAYEASGKLDELTSDKHRQGWVSSLERYVVPVIGDTPVAKIDTQDILRVLTQDTTKDGAAGTFWNLKTDTASRVRNRLETVLAWAAFKGYRSGDNPARWKGHISEELPKPSKIAKTTHKSAVQLDEAPRWFEAVRERDGVAARALEFTALTAARSGEVRGATWDEVDLERGMWVIPAERMKMDREHRVPLPLAALGLLRALPREAGTALVFPAPRGGELRDQRLSELMKAVNEADGQGFLDGGTAAVPHGLRSTFKDWATERTNFPESMAELALAHRVGNEVERAYRRGDMVAKRRTMMDAWADFLEGRETDVKVVPIHG